MRIQRRIVLFEKSSGRAWKLDLLDWPFRREAAFHLPRV